MKKGVRKPRSYNSKREGNLDDGKYLLQDQEKREGIPLPLRTVSRSMKSLMDEREEKRKCHQWKKKERKKECWLKTFCFELFSDFVRVAHLLNVTVGWLSEILPWNEGVRGVRSWKDNTRPEPSSRAWLASAACIFSLCPDSFLCFSLL